MWCTTITPPARGTSRHYTCPAAVLVRLRRLNYTLFLCIYLLAFVLASPDGSVVAALQQPAEYVQAICAALEKSLDAQVRSVATVTI